MSIETISGVRPVTSLGPDSLSRFMREFFRVAGLPLILLILIIIFAFLTPTFMSGENLTGLLRSAAISGIMFLGLTWIFTIGEMDVSFVAVAALTNMVVAGLVNGGYGWPGSIVVAMTAGMSVGLINGWLIAKLGLPPLIITIATGGIASALAAAVGLGSSMAINEPSFLNVLLMTQFGIITLIVLLAAGFYAGAWYAQERLTIGHYIFALATNPGAVREAGIPIERIKMILYVFSSFCSGLGGIFLAVELSSGQPSIAASLFLDGLTAVLLGGTMLKLGRPNVLGTLTSVLILATLTRGGALLGWNDAVFQATKGAMLIAGVAVVVWSNQRR
jgi:ribose transport system permease protein